MLVQFLQEAEIEIELDSHEIYWGRCHLRIKEEEARGDGGEASDGDTGLTPRRRGGKEGEFGRKSLKLQCSPNQASVKPMGSTSVKRNGPALPSPHHAHSLAGATQEECGFRVKAAAEHWGLPTLLLTVAIPLVPQEAEREASGIARSKVQ